MFAPICCARARATQKARHAFHTVKTNTKRMSGVPCKTRKSRTIVRKSMPKRMCAQSSRKTTSECDLGGILIGFGLHWGSILGRWGAQGRPGGSQEASEHLLGASWSVLGAPWARHVRPRGSHWPVWGDLGRFGVELHGFSSYFRMIFEISCAPSLLD